MWRMEQSIIRLVGLTRQHNSLPSFHSSPNTKRLPFMFSQLLNSFYLRILRVATFYPDVAEIWIVMYVLRSKLNQERKGRQAGVQRRRELCLKKIKYWKKNVSVSLLCLLIWRLLGRRKNQNLLLGWEYRGLLPAKWEALLRGYVMSWNAVKDAST